MSIFGVVMFILIAGIAFWCLLFLLGFILPFWITLGIKESLRSKKVFDEENN